MCRGALSLSILWRYPGKTMKEERNLIIPRRTVVVLHARVHSKATNRERITCATSSPLFRCNSLATSREPPSYTVITMRKLSRSARDRERRTRAAAAAAAASSRDCEFHSNLSRKRCKSRFTYAEAYRARKVPDGAKLPADGGNASPRPPSLFVPGKTVFQTEFEDSRN